jgi:cytolysin-activating lysine-acyltransferase
MDPFSGLAKIRSREPLKYFAGWLLPSGNARRICRDGYRRDLLRPMAAFIKGREPARRRFFVGMRQLWRGMRTMTEKTVIADGGHSPSPGTDHSGKTVSTVLGEIVWLMSQSPEYKQYLISDLEWLVMPAILTLQFRIFYHEGKPAGVVLFAWVSENVGARLDSGVPTLRPADWKSGEIFRIVKIIAPFGGGEQFAGEVTNTIFRNHKSNS